jgi:iron complex outermembrane receptor protein
MKKIVSLIILLELFPLTAFALEDSALENELKALHEAYSYTTTASKVKEHLNKTASTVTSIDQAQIREMGARNLLDVLKRVPGFGITQTEYGVRQVEVRGIRTSFSEKVLFLNKNPRRKRRGIF